jgi:hypothetical protein
VLRAFRVVQQTGADGNRPATTAVAPGRAGRATAEPGWCGVPEFVPATAKAPFRGTYSSGERCTRPELRPRVTTGEDGAPSAGPAPGGHG